MKKLLFIFAMLTAAVGIKAQTFYETSFINPADKEQYIGLMIYYNEQECTMRFVNNEMLQNDQMVEVKYHMETEDKESADDIGVMAFAPENDDDDSYPIFAWTWEKSDGSDIIETPIIILGDQKFEATYFKEIELSDMDEEYISQFYGKNEEEYQMMVNGVATVQQNGSSGSAVSDDDDEQPIESASTFYADAATEDNTVPTMHLVFVANTTVSDIGAACERDVKNVSGEISAIAKALKMNFKQYDVNGKNYSLKGMSNAINNLTPAKNDVVLFVYTGHGFRWDNQKSKYPCIDLRPSQYDEIETNYAAMSDIYKMIVSKGARLNIVLSDCCNNKIGENSPIINNGSLMSRSNNNFDIKRLRALFLGSEGNIWATASSPGEYSWCGTTGGYFLNSIIESLRKQISPLTKENPSWDKLVSDAITAAAKKTGNSSDMKAQNGLKEVKASQIQW